MNLQNCKGLFELDAVRFLSLAPEEMSRESRCWTGRLKSFTSTASGIGSGKEQIEGNLSHGEPSALCLPGCNGSKVQHTNSLQSHKQHGICKMTSCWLI